MVREVQKSVMYYLNGPSISQAHCKKEVYKKAENVRVNILSIKAEAKKWEGGYVSL